MSSFKHRPERPRLTLALGLMLSCVPQLELDEAPCPCEQGYTCCETLQRCLAPGDLGCPQSYPPSSANACDTDEDCPPLERCLASRFELAPGGVCRRSCDAQLPCAAGEHCRLAMHRTDTAALSLKNMCLPQGECSDWQCEDCGAIPPGESTCSDDQYFACVVAFHPQCGVSCRVLQIGNCASLVSLCETLACDRCPSGSAEGPVCEGNDVVVCEYTNYEDSTCDAVCNIRVVGSCP